MLGYSSKHGPFRLLRLRFRSPKAAQCFEEYFFELGGYDPEIRYYGPTPSFRGFLGPWGFIGLMRFRVQGFGFKVSVSGFLKFGV